MTRVSLHARAKHQETLNVVNVFREVFNSLRGRFGVVPRFKPDPDVGTAFRYAREKRPASPKPPERGCVQRTSRSNPSYQPRPKVPSFRSTAKLLRLIPPSGTQSRSVSKGAPSHRCATLRPSRSRSRSAAVSNGPAAAIPAINRVLKFLAAAARRSCCD